MTDTLTPATPPEPVAALTTAPPPAPEAITEKLSIALDRAVAAFPGPGFTLSPTSDDLISALETHHAVSDPFAPFRHVPKVLSDTGKFAELTKTTTRTALFRDIELISLDDLAKLRTLAKEYDDAITDQIGFSSPAAVYAFQHQREGLHAAAANRGTDMPEAIFRPLAAFQDEFREKRLALDTRLKAIVAEAFPLCKAAVLAAESFLKTTLRDAEAGERDLCAAYDLDWRPSIMWQVYAVNLMTSRNTIRSFAGRADQGPRQLLAGLIQL